MNKLHKHSWLKLAIIQIHFPIPICIMDKFKRMLKLISWIFKSEDVKYESYSDSIDGRMTVLTVIHTGFHSKNNWPILTKPPSTPINIAAHIFPQFNSERYAIPSIEELFDIKLIKERHPRTASISALLRIKSAQQIVLNTSAKVYDIDYPAPLVEDSSDGLFGNLF